MVQERAGDVEVRTGRNWSVYIILCTDDTFYTGITTDIARRMRQHGEGRGAKYFRGRRPERLVYLEADHDRSSAGKRESFIKSLSRKGKEKLASVGIGQVAG